MNQLKILLLAGNTLRTRAYTQALSHINNINVKGLFLGFKQHECASYIPNEKTINYLKKNNISLPNYGENPISTFKKNEWFFKSIDSKDINSEFVLNEIKKMNTDLIIFSGYGGQILNQDHFKSNIPYLHMHPGFLPSERGSTTIYYSILKKKKCSVTAFYMNKEIDAGELICTNHYPIPYKGVNIDYIFDNSIRADCLKTAIDKIHNNVTIKTNEESTEYYVIHPLLKHLAILSLKEKD
jgi:methionyl-tRNA formyltransferase